MNLFPLRATRMTHILLLAALTLGTTGLQAAERKAAIFAMSKSGGAEPLIQLLHTHIQAELTELHQNVMLLEGAQSEPPASGIEVLLIEIRHIGSDQMLSLQLVQQSNRGLLHTEVIPMPTQVPADSDQLRLIGANAARQLVRKLDRLNLDTRIQAAASWLGHPETTVWHLENIDQCRQDYLIGAIEEGFPGTLEIALEKSPTNNYSVYRYTGQANLQRQTQWLRTLLRFEGVGATAFKIFSSNGQIRVVFEDTHAVNAYLCGGA